MSDSELLTVIDSLNDDEIEFDAECTRSKCPPFPLEPSP
eukprot:CAMPEP_0197024870 /NCGR_PEP_ID=MMETSP1384-20130603/5344_1 /TAXON_ID=29189 /ORGANISM="Ammonia sp." /LENGTH=38 /DNA_ID= /DNA_START= /DNA_END= /DNA_ORIENTATION=